MQYHILFLSKLGKMSQNLLSAAVVIGALRINKHYTIIDFNEVDMNIYLPENIIFKSRQIRMSTEIEVNICFVIWLFICG